MEGTTPTATEALYCTIMASTTVYYIITNTCNINHSIESNTKNIVFTEDVIDVHQLEIPVHGTSIHKIHI